MLAFKNLSEDQGSDYFSDGISEELANVLGRVPGLRVAGSTSAFSFKGRAVPVPEIARQLGVTHIVEGTVRRRGNRVIITAKLLNAADGFQVWVSENLDREVKDSLALQDEIAGLIAKSLSLKLGVSSPAATAAVNPEALRLYLEGREAWSRRGSIEERGNAEAESLFRKAIALEADFARAHASLAVAMSRAYDRAQGSGAEDAPLRKAQAYVLSSFARSALFCTRRWESLDQPSRSTKCSLNGEDAAPPSPWPDSPNVWAGLTRRKRYTTKRGSTQDPRVGEERGLMPCADKPRRREPVSTRPCVSRWKHATPRRSARRGSGRRKCWQSWVSMMPLSRSCGRCMTWVLLLAIRCGFSCDGSRCAAMLSSSN